MRTVIPVKRFVVTRIDSDDMRTLATPCQGRHTYATREEAQKILDLFRPEWISKLGWSDTFEVRECDCYPSHFDPMGVYFD